jgi:hypothetical protein
MDCSCHAADAIDGSLTRRKHLPSNHMLSLVLVSLLCVVGPFGLAQAPVLSKIDPPNWWTELPDPVLLVQGEHLEGARFRSEIQTHELTSYVPPQWSLGVPKAWHQVGKTGPIPPRSTKLRGSHINSLHTRCTREARRKPTGIFIARRDVPHHDRPFCRRRS